jgi:hypothetical protein
MSQPRRVALLDIRTSAGQFRDDAALGSLASKLEALGHSASLVRTVIDADAGAKARAHAELADFVRAGAFDVAVVARAWDEATVGALRGALGPGKKLVRITEGVAAALDARFDHVLDIPGLLALLGGDESPAPAAFRQTRPAELRERAKDRDAVHGERSMPAVVLAGGASSAPPTIVGPATGCPFLLDAAKNPIFASLGADQSKLQMKGCTFCLDNSGSYAQPTEQAVLDAWLSKLRRLRQGKPGKLEVLLADERPHPFLPAFFRALTAEPALAPVELLFKSRVDWLLEHEREVAEAAAIAEQSGSVLHLYLVGFESFDPFHLELFNKGCTVADNLAALAAMRALGERFPRSFEYKRYRAHGVVLFTPWSTPESLLENARVMREVRFHEVRTEAVRTRLRLYPRVPLHALAQKDGLLAEQFSAHRPDRAAEQGYDASVPWRFRDARMEAIFQIASDLSSTEHRLTDADILEIATHYVLRWPGLAGAPDVAHLPLRQAVRAWMLPAFFALQALGPKALGFDVEVDLVALGKKRACLKEGVKTAEAVGLVRAYRAMGLASEVVERHGLVARTDEHRQGDEYSIVAVAADADALAATLAHQRGLTTSPGPAHIAAMGALMAYPSCCVQAFADQGSQGDNIANEALVFRRAPAEPLAPVLHRTAMARVVSHFPCTPSCPPSIEAGEAVLAALAAVDERAASWARERLSRAALFLDYDHRLELSGAWQGDRFRVTDAFVIGDPRRFGVDPGNVQAIEIGPPGARIHLRSGGVQTMESERPLLTIPGAPLAPQVLAAIGGPIAPSRDAEG